MAKVARRYVPKLGLIEQTMGNPEFRQTIQRGLTTTRELIFKGVDLPVDYKGYVGQRLYFDGTYQLAAELARYGFVHCDSGGQHRLVSTDFFDCSLSLTLHSGIAAADKMVKFKWPKGMAVKRSILENNLQYEPPQPGLFDLPRRTRTAPAKRLNLGVVCDLSRKRLRSWIFLGTELLGRRTLMCAELMPICDVAFGQAHIPDLADIQSESSRYDMPPLIEK
jgi:hypothetical protein